VLALGSRGRDWHPTAETWAYAPWLTSRVGSSIRLWHLAEEASCKVRPCRKLVSSSHRRTRSSRGHGSSTQSAASTT
jgi:hypothetical protein